MACADLGEAIRQWITRLLGFELLFSRTGAIHAIRLAGRAPQIPCAALVRLWNFFILPLLLKYHKIPITQSWQWRHMRFRSSFHSFECAFCTLHLDCPAGYTTSDLSNPCAACHVERLRVTCCMAQPYLLSWIAGLCPEETAGQNGTAPQEWVNFVGELMAGFDWKPESLCVKS